MGQAAAGGAAQQQASGELAAQGPADVAQRPMGHQGEDGEQGDHQQAGSWRQHRQRGPCWRGLHAAAVPVRWKVVPTLFWMNAPGSRRAIAWVAFQPVQ